MKHFLRIFLFLALSLPIFCMENADGIELTFPHDQGVVGLIQKVEVVIRGVRGTDTVDFFAIDEKGQRLELCPKIEKDHTKVISILNPSRQENLLAYKADITFYCKGKNSGGCRARKPAKVRIGAVITDKNGMEDFKYSCQFNLYVNRRRGNQAPQPAPEPKRQKHNGDESSKNEEEPHELLENTIKVVSETKMPTKMPEDLRKILNADGDELKNFYF